ncbi:MAG TPA: hypothetical protein VHS74_14360 [Solirubrobacterales bacterium]|jgi:hypothetical protein|nr:hypothetical protein [Solirubrobacterales bacterium]
MPNRDYRRLPASTAVAARSHPALLVPGAVSLAEMSNAEPAEDRL